MRASVVRRASPSRVTVLSGRTRQESALKAITASLLILLASDASAQVELHLYRIQPKTVTSSLEVQPFTMTNCPKRYGFLRFEWTPATTLAKIFTHFVHSNTPCSFRTTYRNGYDDPSIMQQSFRGGSVTMYDPKLPIGPDHYWEEVLFKQGKTYSVLFTWAYEPNGNTTLGCFVNNRLVGYRRLTMAQGRIASWQTHPAWVYGRDQAPVEPTFKRAHHVDGTVRNLVMASWQ